MDAIGQIAGRLAAWSAIVRAAPPSAALRDDVRRAAPGRGPRLVARSPARASTSRKSAPCSTRGRALGGHRLDDYLLVRGYAEAAAWAAQQRDAARARSPPTICERSTGSPCAGIADDAGAWRTETVPPLADGTVPPPHWLVPFETETYVGRLALGADDPAPARAGPRDRAAGSAAAVRDRERPRRALVANLLAYRRGLPPLVLDARARRAYGNALRAALAGDAAPLARVVGTSLARGLERLRDAVEPAGELRPLADFGPKGRADRLYKAAQRGRLRVVRREGRLFTTAPWVAAYAARTSSESA